MAERRLYNQEISVFFKTRRWPKGFKATIVKRTASQTGDPYLQFVVFRDNFNAFDGEDRLQIAMMVKEFMEKVRGMGVPIYMEVAKGDGRAEENRVRLDA